MKTTIPLLLSSFALAGLPALAQDDPFQPIGSIDVANSWVRTGVRPQVTWDITYPLHVPDLVIPEPSGRVTTREEVRVKVRVVGVAFQSGSTLLPVTFNTKIGSGPWQELFRGTSDDVQPEEFVFNQVVPAGTVIDFGGQGRRSSGEWYDPRTTENADIAVTGLLNGETPPSYAPAYEQGSIESFLSSYISEDGNVQVGPRDMLYLIELASRNPGDWWFDMQDVVVAVTYEATTSSGPAPTLSQNNGLFRDLRGGRRNGERKGPKRPKRPSLGFQPSSEPSPGDEVRD